MTDAEYEEQKTRFLEVAKKWRKIIGIDWWRINYLYDRNPPDTREHHPHTIMWVTPDWRYMEATINVYLQAIQEMDDETLEYALLHEYAHVMINELRGPNPSDEELDHEERVATTLAWSWIWTRQAFEPVEEETEGKQCTSTE